MLAQRAGLAIIRTPRLVSDSGLRLILPDMQTEAGRELTEKLALELLECDGLPVIWLLHLTAARARGDGHLRAAETLLEIADMAERYLRQADAAEPRWRGTSHCDAGREDL